MTEKDRIAPMKTRRETAKTRYKTARTRRETAKNRKNPQTLRAVCAASLAGFPGFPAHLAA
jgi:hypothetical protein